MSPRDLLGVVFRAGGVALCLVGVFDLYGIFLSLLGDGSRSLPTKLIADSAFFFLVGAGVLLGADWLARSLYETDRKAD